MYIIDNLKCYNTIISMMQQRGYLLKQSLDEYIIFHKNNKNDICILKTIHKKLDSDLFNHNILSIHKQKGFKHIILVFSICQTPSVKKLIKQYKSILYIETFHLDFLLINITKNKLVPLHQSLSKNDILKLQQTINIQKLPKISSNDPISKFYNFRKGDIIKIHRTDCITFRLCI